MKTMALLLSAAFAATASPPGIATEILSRGDGPLEQLGRLIIGTWEAEGSRHVIEWGVGRRLIRSQSFFRIDGEWKLVSEGMWYHDDEEKAIRGIHIAIDMPVHRFDYTTVVRGDTVIHQLRAHGETIEQFIESWIFDGTGYRWTLVRPGARPEQVMTGRYRRVTASGHP